MNAYAAFLLFIDGTPIIIKQYRCAIIIKISESSPDDLIDCILELNPLSC